MPVPASKVIPYIQRIYMVIPSIRSVHYCLFRECVIIHSSYILEPFMFVFKCAVV
jgi:hypothetical protein